jgi:CHAT domain-containing protein
LDQHLDSDQIDELLQAATDVKPDETTNREHLENARRHLKDCAGCQIRMRAHEQAMERLALLKPTTPGAKGPICPPDEVWLEIAAGTARRDSEEYLSHAAQCDHCGPMLQRAIADFTDELSPEEERDVAKSHYASMEGQRGLAQELSGHAPSSHVTKRRYGSLLLLPRMKRIAATVVFALIGAGSIGWYVWWHSSEQLVARAYVEKRTLEMRMEGLPHVPYVPLPQERGTGSASNKRGRPILLRAESEISQALQAHPDDVGWLQASGRVSLLEGDADSAIAFLNKAAQLAPNNESVKIDLATAYYQNGDAKQAANDLAPLFQQGKNEVAIFNYALALEGLLDGGAEEAWEEFLMLYPHSEWAAEARAHLSKLRQKTQKQKGERGIATANADRIAEYVTTGNQNILDEMDAQPERFLEIALTEWLPRVFSPNALQSHQTQTDLLALTSLAHVMSQDHQDTWLDDFLKASHNTPELIAGVRLGRKARQTLAVADSDGSIAASGEAASRFKRAHLAAGVLYAQFELAYANQLSHRNAECAEISRAILESPAISRYAWLHIQAEIESAICASLSDGRAPEELRNASRLATEHSYPVLHSRAEQVLSSSYWGNGDERSAWKTTERGLQDFWEKGLPSLRGYNLLTNLDYLAEDDELWFLKAAVIRESIPMIDDDPDLAMQAFEWSRLGQTLVIVGDLDGADSSFQRAQDLFRSVPEGSRRTNLSAEASIGLADIDIRRGRPQSAVTHLNAIQDTINKIPDDDLKLEFLKTYGLALLNVGDRETAQKSLYAAVGLAEKGLDFIPNERDRFRWMRRNEVTYRTMVELTLNTDPVKALAYWEYYRGASLRTSTLDKGKVALVAAYQRHLLSSVVESQVARNEVLVSYFLSSGNIHIWIVDERGIQERSLPVRISELKTLVAKFREECAEPQSDLHTLRGHGLDLYQQLLLPIEPLLVGHDRLIIEPDRVMADIPFGALVDEAGGYLSDRYEILVSPGVKYSGPRGSSNVISRNSRALVVGNPTASGWSYLRSAEQEASTVAGMFENSRLLLRDDVMYASVAEALPDSDVFHFSGHGVANSTSAGLVLGEDGLLDAFRLEQLHLPRTKLVVLSACVSGRGSRGFFDDEDSLPRLFLAAGVPRVVASNWMVDSSATEALMKNFYSNLMSGKPIDNSWSGAVRDLKSQDIYAHPYYWAGFTIFGSV